MLYAKKLISGLLKETSEQKADHVLLSLDEADDLAMDLEQFKSERDDARISTKKVEEKIEDLKREHNREMMQTITRLLNDEEFSVKEAKEAAEKKYRTLEDKYAEAWRLIDDLTAENNLLQNEYDREKDLNRMFRRMATQRANQNNGQPQKGGCGYVIISSAQVKDRVWDDYYVDSWKSVLKTPYSAELPLQLIRRDIRTDLIFTVLGAIGIERLQEHSKNGCYQIWDAPADDGTKISLNGVYRWIYRINARENLWEIEIFHNLPIFVSADMLPQKPTGKRGQNKHS